jgi:RNA polymerase sigma-70 factor (ECF subfamily)
MVAWSRSYIFVEHRGMKLTGKSENLNTAAFQLDEETRQGNVAVAEGLKAHDPQLLDRLISQYQHRLLRYLLYLTRNQDLSEDLCQETWMRVVTRGVQFKGNSRFGTWLFTIARHLVFDLRRKRSMASLEQMCKTEGGHPLEATSQDRTPFDHCANLENKQRITEAFLALKPLHREVLLLRFHEEMSLQEIAGVIGAPISTVKARLYRALAVLKPRMIAVMR